MDTARITNANLMDLDWARSERQAFLAKQSGRKLRPARSALNQVSMVDTVVTDQRSVPFQLRGGFSGRVVWWELFSTAHQLFSRSGTLEASMFRFHRIHHAATCALLKHVQNTRQYATAILRDGFAKATCDQVARVVDHMKGSDSR